MKFVPNKRLFVKIQNDDFVFLKSVLTTVNNRGGYKNSTKQKVNRTKIFITIKVSVKIEGNIPSIFLFYKEASFCILNYDENIFIYFFK